MPLHPFIKTTLLYSAVVITYLSPAFSQPISRSRCQNLIQSRSEVHFEATSRAFNLSGKITDYIGELLFDRLSPANGRVRIEANPRSISLGQRQTQNPILQLLLQSLGQANLIFSSSTVSQIGPDRLLVSGTVRQGQQRSFLRFPVEVVESSDSATRIKGSISGTALSSPNSGPLAGVTGTVHFNLLFSTNASSKPGNLCAVAR